MTKKELYSLCCEKMKEKGIFNAKHQDRFLLEWKDIAPKEQEIEYFSKLYEEDAKFQENENNLLVPYLLGIVEDFNITQPPKYEYGDFPDIDVDYIDGVREYLKEEYSKKLFGEDYICNIASYHTFGIKSALKDVARLFGLDHLEVEAVNKTIKHQDGDGKVYSWDECSELFDEFRDYCERYPQVADVAKKLVGRINNLGQHASGLVVSSVPIHNYIPLVRGKEGSPASAWVEGLQGTDLSTVGFIKFDFLGLDGNSKIATTCKMACGDKKTKKASELLNNLVGDMTVCALPGLQENGEAYPSWSDTSYLNDEKALKMANRGDLRMIFQFDGSQSIRNLAKQIGISSFDDLVATTALFRPGPLRSKLHERYILRKHGQEDYTIHSLLVEGEGNLSSTYGILVYQENISRLLNTVGKIPWADCDVVRKAISKKKVDKFQKYKEQFITNGQEVLGESKEYLTNLWIEIERFSSYAFNLSVDKNTIINTTYGNKKIENVKSGDYVYCVNSTGKTVETKVLNLHNHGILEGYEVRFDDGYSVTCTLNHKFLTEQGQKPLWEILENNYSILCDPNIENKNAEEKTEGWKKIRLARNFSEHTEITNTESLVSRKIVRVVPVGKRQMYDIEVANPTHNFLLPTGIVTSNSHAVGYTYLSSRMLWLKANLPKHFIASMFTHTKANGPEDYERLKEYKQEATNLGVKIAGLDVNKSKNHFTVNEDGVIYYGFSKIKGVGEEIGKKLEELQPYTSFEDLLCRFGTSSKVIKPIIALKCFKDYDPLFLYRYYEQYKQHIKNEKDRMDRHRNILKNLEKQMLESPDKIDELKKKLANSMARKEKKDEFSSPPALATYNPEGSRAEVDPKFIKLLSAGDEEIETAYYGYLWQHPIEKLENYQGHTFQEFIDSGDRDGLVEVFIRSVVVKKGPKVTYHSFQIEDAYGKYKRINVWYDEYQRFQEELQVDKAVRLWITKPKEPLFPFNLYQYPGSKWRKIPRQNDKRVIPLN